MSIKRILVPLPGSATHAGEIDIAMSVASALEARVEALFITEPTPVMRGTAAGGYPYPSSFGRDATAMATANPYIEMREREAQDARETFSRACAANGIPIVAPDDDSPTLPAASWRETEGSYATAAMQRAAAFDLMIAGSAAMMDSLMDIAERSLLQVRRPVLLAPSRHESELTGTVMIAWDESPECWHAVSAALPFLKLARSVIVVSVDRNAESRRASQAELLAYLRCHGIEATAKVVAPHLRSVGDTLLAEAGEQDTSLMVMGAYSHSRLREMLHGGATRHVLKHSAARPVLMAH